MFSPSELILNSDGSIYHLNLHPEDIADTIILVGDPGRVPRVSKYFDRVTVKKSKREFVTHSGYLGNKKLSVVGTGIGVGNIDIVLNELDALVNIDFKTREIRSKIKSLKIIRMGTAGALRADLPVDSLLISQYAIGLDGLLSYYQWPTELLSELNVLANQSLKEAGFGFAPYVAHGDEGLISQFSSLEHSFSGITATCLGFYGPQGRVLRLNPQSQRLFEALSTIKFSGLSVTNLEMETAAIYGLCSLLGHQACSISTLVANRQTGEFSSDSEAAVDEMIKRVLEIISEPIQSPNASEWKE